MPRFINDNYACLDNKGTHRAVLKLQKYMRVMKRTNCDYYILKCDVKKFFYSINKNILFSFLQDYIGDKKLMNLTKKLIYDSSEEVGIPIGNYTSQFFANIYLDKLDHYVKDVLKVKYYVRYMDDFVMLVENKEIAKYLLDEVDHFLSFNLKLSLNKKSKYYPSKLGVDFCGYKIYETHIKIRKRSINKIKKKIKIWNKDYLNNHLDFHQFLLCFNSFKGHIKHANCYNLYNKLVDSIEFNKDIIEFKFQICYHL